MEGFYGIQFEAVGIFDYDAKSGWYFQEHGRDPIRCDSLADALVYAVYYTNDQARVFSQPEFDEVGEATGSIVIGVIY